MTQTVRRRWGPRNAKGLSDSVLTVGIKQGSGATVPVAFGASSSTPQCSRPKPPKRRKPKARKKQGGAGVSLNHWDAFAPQHLALPRAVAPYTVIRTTAVWSPSTEDQRKLVLFCPSIDTGADAGQWTSSYAFGTNTPLTSLRNATNGIRRYCFSSMTTSSWQAASVVPAAFSIQVLNPEALQSSAGMVYLGRCKNKVHMSEGHNSESFQTLADNLVAFSNPRMCSAGKLALRGVQIDGVPNNMSELARFTSLSQVSDANFTLNSNNGLHQEGFNPIFLYNPGSVDLQVLVCCEWRVRFDPSNPAYAACRMHKPSSENDWASNIEKAVSMGSGVVDIVERVARQGRALGYL